jgi:putative membrane protein
MKKLLMTWLLNGISLPITAEVVNQFVPNGISLRDASATIGAAALLGAVNTFIRPVLKFLTFPLTLLTLGLSALLLNVACLLAVDWYLTGFEIHGWMAALGGTIILSLVSTVLNGLFNQGN